MKGSLDAKDFFLGAFSQISLTFGICMGVNRWDLDQFKAKSAAPHQCRRVNVLAQVMSPVPTNLSTYWTIPVNSIQLHLMPAVDLSMW